MYDNTKIRKGFTIIESIVYIFISIIILLGGIKIMFDIYKGYIEDESVSRNYNQMQMFYTNLDYILNKDVIRDVDIGEDYILIYREYDTVLISKNVQSNRDALGAKFSSKISPNIILKEVKNFKVVRKNKLIYFIIINKNGKEFVRCL